MTRGPSRILIWTGLLAALLAAAVALGAWLGERSLAAGRAAQRRGAFAAADAAYGAALRRGNVDAALERARLRLARRDWAGAEASLRTAMALAPSRGLPHAWLARLSLERPGPWDRDRESLIVESCGRAVSLEPARADLRGDCAGFLLSLATRVRADADDARVEALREEAAEGFAAALALNPAAARGVFDAALAAGGDVPLLIDIAFRRADGRALTALVGLLAERTLWAQAEPGCWAAAEARGSVPIFAAAAADALVRRSLVREALAAVRRGLRERPGDGALSARAADLTGRLPGQEGLAALDLYRGLLAADPRNAAVRRRFAAFLNARGMHADAEREARALVDADPRDAEAWFQLGESLRRVGRPEQAAAAYRAAAGLRPANATYRRAAGRI